MSWNIQNAGRKKMSTKNPIFSKTILQKIKIFKTFPDKQKFREVLVVVSLKKKKKSMNVLGHFSHVQLFATPWTIYSTPGSSVHGIILLRIPDWVAMLSSRGSSQPRNWPHMSYVSYVGRILKDSTQNRRTLESNSSPHEEIQGIGKVAT